MARGCDGPRPGRVSLRPDPFGRSMDGAVGTAASPGRAEPSPDISPPGVPSRDAVGSSAGVCPSLTSSSAGAEDPSVAPDPSTDSEPSGASASSAGVELSADPSVAGTSAPEPMTASSAVPVPSTGATSPIGAEPSLGTDSSGVGVDSGAALSVVSAFGAGTSGEAAGASAGRAARSSSGSRYSCLVSATRTPKCRCGRSTSRSPVSPTAPIRSPEDTSSPRLTSISDRWRYDVSNCPSAVRIDTVLPEVPSEPA